MKTWVKLLITTAAFWAVWIGIAGLAMVAHGDCGISTADAQITACVHEKAQVGIVAMAAGLVVYGLLIWRVVRRRSDS